MVDFSQPVPLSIVLASIGFIFFCVAIGLMVVIYYKRKLNVEDRKR
jgi:hypothetical protein